MRYRDTFAKIDLDNIEYNVKSIINKYNGYDYYFGVVKADCYGHNKAVEAIIKGGCNYLVVAILEEALSIRAYYPDIPILCLGIIPSEYLNIAYENNITITVNSLEYAKKVIDSKLNLNVHIKLNTGNTPTQNNSILPMVFLDSNIELEKNGKKNYADFWKVK